MPAYQFESSGKLRAQSPAALQQADSGASIIAYTNGTTADGRAYYAYIAVKPSKYREFHQKSKARQSMKLNDYGKIIVYGYEPKAPTTVVQHMRSKYGFDEEYETRLRSEVENARREFSIGQEEKRLMDIVAMMKMKNGAGKK